MFDIAATGLATLAAQAFTRRRRTGSYVNGVWTIGADETEAAVGVIVPARGQDLKRLPEGRRTEYAIRILTETELKTSDQEVAAGSSGGMTDLVEFGSETFEVESVQPWGDRYYDAVAVRRGD